MNVQKMKCNAQSVGMELKQVNRKIGWDILRIILVFIVFFFHCNIHLGITFGRFTDFISVGAICMTGFFVLSGTVIGYKEGCVSQLSLTRILKQFTQRALAVLPLYWIVVLLYYLDNSITHEEVLMLPASIFGIQAFFQGSFSLGHNGGTWFVSCLLFCYAVFPMIQLIISCMGIRYKLMLLASLCLLDIYVTLITAHLGFGESYSTPFLRCIQFAIGVAIGSVFNLQIDRRREHPIRIDVLAIIGSGIVFALMLIIITCLVRNGFGKDYSYLQRMVSYDFVVAPAFVGLIALLGLVSYARTRMCKAIAKVSSFSYSFFWDSFLYGIGQNEYMKDMLCRTTRCAS